MKFICLRGSDFPSYTKSQALHFNPLEAGGERGGGCLSCEAVAGVSIVG
jgi:hypothetical protein